MWYFLNLLWLAKLNTFLDSIVNYGIMVCKRDTNVLIVKAEAHEI
jgi:hypothetical protein